MKCASVASFLFTNAQHRKPQGQGMSTTLSSKEDSDPVDKLVPETKSEANFGFVKSERKHWFGKGKRRGTSATEDGEINPPRPPNAWILYRSSKVKELRGLERGEGQSTKAQPTSASSSSIHTPLAPGTASSRSKEMQADASKRIASMWKAETVQVRQQYSKLAEEMKRTHAEMYPTYKYRPKRQTSSSSLKGVVRGVTLPSPSKSRPRASKKSAKSRELSIDTDSEVTWSSHIAQSDPPSRSGSQSATCTLPPTSNPFKPVHKFLDLIGTPTLSDLEHSQRNEEQLLKQMLSETWSQALSIPKAPTGAEEMNEELELLDDKNCQKFDGWNTPLHSVSSDRSFYSASDNLSHPHFSQPADMASTSVLRSPPQPSQRLWEYYGPYRFESNSLELDRQVIRSHSWSARPTSFFSSSLSLPPSHDPQWSFSERRDREGEEAHSNASVSPSLQYTPACSETSEFFSLPPPSVVSGGDTMNNIPPTVGETMYLGPSTAPPISLEERQVQSSDSLPFDIPHFASWMHENAGPQFSDLVPAQHQHGTLPISKAFQKFHLSSPVQEEEQTKLGGYTSSVYLHPVEGQSTQHNLRHTSSDMHLGAGARSGQVDQFQQRQQQHLQLQQTLRSDNFPSLPEWTPLSPASADSWTPVMPLSNNRSAVTPSSDAFSLEDACTQAAHPEERRIHDQLQYSDHYSHLSIPDFHHQQK